MVTPSVLSDVLPAENLTGSQILSQHPADQLLVMCEEDNASSLGSLRFLFMSKITVSLTVIANLNKNTVRLTLAIQAKVAAS